MTDKIGQVERRTQERIIRLFAEQLSYAYLGNWHHREGNSNIEPELLAAYLRSTGSYDDTLIARAIDQLRRAANDSTKTPYERNRDVYEILRYGAKLPLGPDQPTVTVWLIDWANPENNHFGVAEEVTLPGAEFGKRPDIVLYVNGIALGMLELKRSIVEVGQGIRQLISSQRSEFIQNFFSTMQLLAAGNDTEGLRYGTIETPQKYYLKWREDSPITNPLDRAITQLFSKDRFLEIVHDFIVFDSGIKKVPRHNQYFGVKAAQEYVDRKKGGIIWHTQGSGKSLTMVWLAKWILEHDPAARVLIVTDRIELDKQIAAVFKGVGETIKQSRSGQGLLADLNKTEERLMCSLIHKFGASAGTDTTASAYTEYIKQIQESVPSDFEAKGNIFVFVDECHRTQSGKLHQAMKTILPDATFIGFTGTPLLKKDKATSREVFGPYIHTYKFDEAVADGVIVDLRYEARDIDQRISSQEKIDAWFETHTRELTEVAKARLKKRWGTMREILSSKDRLDQIAADIELDMATRPRLMDGHGNAILVAANIYEACVFYERFSQGPLKGKCAIVTSYRPHAGDIATEDVGDGETLPIRQFNIYRQMLADWFGEPADQVMGKVDKFEEEVIDLFINEPGRMRLLIVVDRLLTGFDAPPATYLYIDKSMRDHGLFQAICRVNRVDEGKEYGYIIDYKDLFDSLTQAVSDYTGGAFEDYEEDDVKGLLQDRVSGLRSDLLEALEEVRVLVEPVEPPKGTQEYIHYFCGPDPDDRDAVASKTRRRLVLYRSVGRLVRTFAELAPDYEKAVFTLNEIEAIKAEVATYEAASAEVRLASGDYIDLKMYEPAMRHLIDTYIKAEETKVLAAFDDMTLVELIVDRGKAAIDQLPEGIKGSKDATAEAIEGNIRRLIIDETPVNPKYYEKMSQLLDDLIRQRRERRIEYEEYLQRIIELARQVKDPAVGGEYPATINSPGLRALYDSLGRDESLALKLNSRVRETIQDGWRGHAVKLRRIRNAVEETLDGCDEALIEEIMELLKVHDEF